MALAGLVVGGGRFMLSGGDDLTAYMNRRLRAGKVSKNRKKNGTADGGRDDLNGSDGPCYGLAAGLDL